MAKFTNKDYLETTKSQKIKDMKKEVEKFMKNDNYIVFCGTIKDGEFTSNGSCKDIGPDILEEIFEKYIEGLKQKCFSGEWEELD